MCDEAQHRLSSKGGWVPGEVFSCFNTVTEDGRSGSGANCVFIGSDNNGRLIWDWRHLIVREALLDDGAHLQKVLLVCGD
jgi:hypothetical protein